MSISHISTITTLCSIHLPNKSLVFIFRCTISTRRPSAGFQHQQELSHIVMETQQIRWRLTNQTLHHWGEGHLQILQPSGQGVCRSDDLWPDKTERKPTVHSSHYSREFCREIQAFGVWNLHSDQPNQWVSYSYREFQQNFLGKCFITKAGAKAFCDSFSNVNIESFLILQKLLAHQKVHLRFPMWPWTLLICHGNLPSQMVGPLSQGSWLKWRMSEGHSGTSVRRSNQMWPNSL